MSAVLGLVNHRVCSDPAAALTLPTAWHALLSPDAAVPDADALARVATQIADEDSPGFQTMVSARLAEMRRAGASFAAMLAGDGEVPVAASLLVSPLPAKPTTVTRLEVEWLVDTPREFRRVDLPVGPGLVGAAVRTVDVDDVSSADAYDWQVAIPHPVTGGLLLVFSSPLVPIKELFDEVFLNIARTVRWQQKWRS